MAKIFQFSVLERTRASTAGYTVVWTIYPLILANE
jgi:hypothetical protein